MKLGEVIIFENFCFLVEEVFNRLIEECEKMFFVRKFVLLIDYVVNDVFVIVYRS